MDAYFWEFYGKCRSFTKMRTHCHGPSEGWGKSGGKSRGKCFLEWPRLTDSRFVFGLECKYRIDNRIQNYVTLHHFHVDFHLSASMTCYLFYFRALIKNIPDSPGYSPLPPKQHHIVSIHERVRECVTRAPPLNSLRTEHRYIYIRIRAYIRSTQTNRQWVLVGSSRGSIACHRNGIYICIYITYTYV